VWQLLGVEQIQNGGHCHGNQGAKNVKFSCHGNKKKGDFNFFFISFIKLHETL
jgi:hypothetical protein